MEGIAKNSSKAKELFTQIESELRSILESTSSDTYDKQKALTELEKLPDL